MCETAGGLPPELWQTEAVIRRGLRLSDEAGRAEFAKRLVAPVARQLLREPGPAQRDEAIRLLASWRQGDEREQQQTWKELKQALDEDRPSHRKLFP